MLIVSLLLVLKATCHPSFMDQLSSALPVDARLQVDGTVTTAQGPAVTVDFALYLAEKLYGKQILESVLLKRMVSDFFIITHNMLSSCFILLKL